jgi:hypothetical protein
LASTPLSKFSTALSTSKKKGKRTRQEAFADENQAEAQIIANFNAEKHVRKMAEFAQRMAELELKKQRMALEADEKRLQVEAHRLSAQHQREREKEQYELQVLRLRLQYQGSNAAVGSMTFPMDQLAGPSTFGDIDQQFGPGILPFNT